MHRLSSAFVLGFHGCDKAVGEAILAGGPFKLSTNDYDWLGSGIYFWEANPKRGLEWVVESSLRPQSAIKNPFVVGAIIDLGSCLDLTTYDGIQWVRIAYRSFNETLEFAGAELPENSKDGLRRRLDCAILNHLHVIREEAWQEPVQTVKGIFTEGKEIYPDAGFYEKTHVQIAVCDPNCIKGVFRVADHLLLN